MYPLPRLEADVWRGTPIGIDRVAVSFTVIDGGGSAPVADKKRAVRRAGLPGREKADSPRVASLALIRGGKAPEAATAALPVALSASEEAEAEELRQALLKLVLPEFGVTVLEALLEIFSLMDSEDHAEYVRASNLCRALEAKGIDFQLLNPALGIPRPGFLKLCYPQKLLAVHPELGKVCTNRL